MPHRILVVCLGNICRSPLAHGIFESLLDDNFFIDSAGTGAYHIGNPPDPRSMAVAKKNGIDIGQQRARQFGASDFDDFDTIYVMDRQNYTDVCGLARNENDLQKVQLLCKAAGLDSTDVPDPYYGGAKGFDTVFELIQTACKNLKESY
ncbi:MAG: low molecular weight protein-tyrosine-phosphatase [Flavobacteriaceae bacterium]|jgi:protein-tyrosine phosphatase